MRSVALEDVGTECQALARAAGRFAGASLAAFGVGLAASIALAANGQVVATALVAGLCWLLGAVLGAFGTARLRAARLAAGRYVTGRDGVAGPIRRRAAFEVWRAEHLR